MAQAINRVQALPLDTHNPYYTINSYDNHMIRAKSQVLQVISGLAWVSNHGEDFVLKPGDAITLSPGGDAVVMVSGLFRKPVKYILKD